MKGGQTPALYFRNHNSKRRAESGGKTAVHGGWKKRKINKKKQAIKKIPLRTEMTAIPKKVSKRGRG